MEEKFERERDCENGKQSAFKEVLLIRERGEAVETGNSCSPFTLVFSFHFVFLFLFSIKFLLFIFIGKYTHTLLSPKKKLIHFMAYRESPHLGYHPLLPLSILKRKVEVPFRL